MENYKCCVNFILINDSIKMQIVCLFFFEVVSILCFFITLYNYTNHTNHTSFPHTIKSYNLATEDKDIKK